MTDIIDPPVGPYSDIEDIKDWIKKLEAMPKSIERDEALDEAKDWLNRHPDYKEN